MTSETFIRVCCDQESRELAEAIIKTFAHRGINVGQALNILDVVRITMKLCPVSEYSLPEESVLVEERNHRVRPGVIVRDILLRDAADAP